MRNRRLSFEQLVKQNKREILEDEDIIKQLELRLENKHVMNLQENFSEDFEIMSSER